MKVLTLLAISAACLTGGMTSRAQTAQSMPRLEPGQTNDWRLCWDSIYNRTYFVESSTDLIHWSYLETISLGDGLEQFLEINATGGENRLFLRLRYIDAAPGGVGWHPSDDDFDGDGLTNQQETIGGTNPFDADTDGDGAPDNIEVTSGTNANDPADVPVPPVELCHIDRFADRHHYQSDFGVDGIVNSGTTVWDDHAGGGTVPNPATDGVPAPVGDAYALSTYPDPIPFSAVPYWNSGQSWPWNYAFQAVHEGEWETRTTTPGDGSPPQDYEFKYSGASIFSTMTQLRAKWKSPVEIRRIYLLCHDDDETNPDFTPDTVQVVEFIIPAGGTDSQQVEVAANLGTQITNSTAWLVPVEFERDVDTLDGNWEPLEGSLLKALPGQKINLRLNTDILPAGVTVTNPGWEIDGAHFDFFSVLEGKVEPITESAREKNVLEFRWSETGQHAVTLSVDILGARRSISTHLHMVRPDCSLSVVDKGVARVDGLTHKAGLLSSPNSEVGIRWKGKVTTPQDLDPLQSSKWCFAQVLTPNFRLVRSGVPKTIPHNTLVGLDNEFPYVPYNTTGEFASGHEQPTDDSPGFFLVPTTDSEFQIAVSFDT